MITEPHSLAMTRLFDPRDIEFLHRVPGYSHRTETEFRRRRCRIFRQYLRTVRAELLDALTAIEAPAEVAHGQREPASWRLGWRMRYRLRFAAATVPAYTRLFRYRWDLGTLQLADVVRRFDAILSGARQRTATVRQPSQRVRCHTMESYGLPHAN